MNIVVNDPHDTKLR